MIEFYKDPLGREWDDTEDEFKDDGFDWYITSWDEVADGVTITIKIWVNFENIQEDYNPDEDIDRLIIKNMLLDNVYCSKSGDKVPTPEGVTLPNDSEAIEIAKGVLSYSNIFSDHVLKKIEMYSNW